MGKNVYKLLYYKKPKSTCLQHVIVYLKILSMVFYWAHLKYYSYSKTDVSETIDVSLSPIIQQLISEIQGENKFRTFFFLCTLQIGKPEGLHPREREREQGQSICSKRNVVEAEARRSFVHSSESTWNQLNLSSLINLHRAEFGRVSPPPAVEIAIQPGPIHLSPSSRLIGTTDTHAHTPHIQPHHMHML
jgi:hypothetical protein